ncbi:MAG: hypothetical protein OXN23_07590 [Gammaproteobacteria bacterium]|nr:hypothetical protein [Gammaproteobacteria bacterium]MDE0302762.1 hypothetical protein [Gammaproteobacteria bacterium]MDE0611117.1 hypothetical protein [Gammaproteobacteria bacterium]
MRAALLAVALSAPVLADGDPAGEVSRRILQEAETHIHELQRLHATDALLEIQLRIAKKLQECRQTGYPCPGAELIPSPPGEVDHPDPIPARTLDLPRLINIYQGRAQLRLDSGQHIEVRSGQQLGPWQIHSVGIDSLEVQGSDGMRFRIPLEGRVP